MFESRVLDSLSRVHPAVPVIIFVPVIVVLAAWGLQTLSILVAVALAAAGYALWTLFEYWLHRVVFHFEPEDGFGARMHWIIHGVHHDHPNDPMRLVMPPAVSIPLGAIVFGVLYLILGAHAAAAAGPRAGSGGCCANATCATISRTTHAGSGSAPHTGTRSSAPRRATSDPRNKRVEPRGGLQPHPCSRLDSKPAPAGASGSARFTSRKEEEPWPPPTSTGSC
jgi:hypothetical protein